MFFGNRFFRKNKNDKVGTNNLVKGLEEIVEDEMHDLDDLDDPDKESLEFTFREIITRGSMVDGWEIQPSTNVSKNKENVVFAYKFNEDYKILIGCYKDRSWPYDSMFDRPFIEWMAVVDNQSEYWLVIGDAVKYCISKELLSVVKRAWKEREAKYQKEFDTWFNKNIRRR